MKNRMIFSNLDCLNKKFEKSKLDNNEKIDLGSSHYTIKE